MNLTVNRSADGSTVTSDATNPGNGGLYHPAVFAVATDAKNFDQNGSMTVTLTNEFAFADAPNGLATATATFADIFEPAAEGPPPPPTGIPLPPSVWGGLVLLGCCGAFAKVRQLRPA